jgi:hypothetical protein
VEYGLQHRDLEGVACIGIDEISRRKGHVYHTQVYDLTTPVLVGDPFSVRAHETIRIDDPSLSERDTQLLLSPDYQRHSRRSE